NYLERNAAKRVAPQLVLPEARSIIALATSYAPANRAEETASDEVSSGFVARYARFTDYHEIIGARLKELTAFVNRQGNVGTRSLWYVDTGPLLERDFA